LLDNQLQNKGYTVKRFAGKDRYETCNLINEEVGADKSEIFIADGNNFQECLTANSSSIMNNKLFYMVPPDPASQQIKMIDSMSGLNKIYAVGSIEISLLKQRYSSPKITSLGVPANSYFTSSQVATADLNKGDVQNNDKLPTVIICTGENFPDGLAVSSLVAKYGAPLLQMSSKEGSALKVETAQPGNHIGRVFRC
jgi:hypothetical protein